MKRYCQTLTLVDDEAMIAKYVEAHAHVWPEVIKMCPLADGQPRHLPSDFRHP